MPIGDKLHIIHFSQFHQNMLFPVNKVIFLGRGLGLSQTDSSLSGEGTPSHILPLLHTKPFKSVRSSPEFQADLCCHWLYNTVITAINN